MIHLFAGCGAYTGSDYYFGAATVSSLYDWTRASDVVVALTSGGPRLLQLSHSVAPEPHGPLTGHVAGELTSYTEVIAGSELSWIGRNPYAG